MGHEAEGKWKTRDQGLNLLSMGVNGHGRASRLRVTDSNHFRRLRHRSCPELVLYYLDLKTLGKVIRNWNVRTQ